MPDTDITKESSSDLSDDEPQVFELPFKTMPDRLDKVLARLMPEHSRSRLQAWIEGGHVTVNGAAAKIRQTVGPADRIEVREQVAPEQQAFSAEPVDFDVIAESPDWIVVNKPAGLVTHPGAGNWSGTLLNGLLYRYPELSTVPRAGIVHRLDKDTSGLLVVARHEKSQTHLVRQLQDRSVKRQYAALAHGWVNASGTVNQPIGRDPRVPVRMTTDRPIAAREAITHFSPERLGVTPENQPVSQLVCQLETGRTHQIRVHLSSICHPLVADVLYGGQQVAGAVRQMLHAQALAFDDVASGGRVSFQAPLPDDFESVMAHMVWQS